ncbi:phage holin, lambda family [Pseudomonas sp. Marseille-Q8238]
MPDRPETWAMLLAWLEHHHPLVYAAVLSATIAAARLIYSGGSIRRSLGEGFICGLITLALSNGLPLFGVPIEVAPFFGGVVGLIGADGIRAGLKQLAKRKVDTL